MVRGFDMRMSRWLSVLVLLSGIAVVRAPFAQNDHEASKTVEQFLQAIVDDDSAAAYELCSSGLKRGKTAGDFLDAPEITTVFSGMDEWETIDVAAKGSIVTVIVKLADKDQGNLSALGVDCLKMRGNYKVRDLSPTTWAGSEARYLRYLSDLYMQLDQLDAAKASISKAYSLDPDDPKVAGFMGYVSLHSETNMDQAKELIQGAHEQMPEDPEFMDFLGWYYHKTNQRQESIQWFDRAREAFKKTERYQSSPEYIRFSDHVSKAKATGWRPTQT